jgi:hypothetical protein
MFKIQEDLSIYATRGDIVFFDVSAKDDGEVYVFQPGDLLRIKVFEKKACNCVVMQKDFPVISETEKVSIFLTEQDTRIGDIISKPVDYWYEIELNPTSNPQTIIGYDEEGAKVFKLFPEGKDVEISDIEPEDIPVVDKDLDATSPRPVQNQAIASAINKLRGDVSDNRNSCQKNAEDIEAHVANKSNPHNVTKVQLGLGNVPNVSTNDQTPTFVQASALENVKSGEKVTTLFGKIAKGLADLISHLKNTNNPHGVTAEQVNARPATWTPTFEDVGASPASHATDKNNPHNVTAAQVGARASNWMPTASEVGATPVSHLNDKSNPHGVTAAQVGARPSWWLPTAAEVGARPSWWMPTASEVGATPASHLNDKENPHDVTIMQVLADEGGILPVGLGGTGAGDTEGVRKKLGIGWFSLWYNEMHDAEFGAQTISLVSDVAVANTTGEDGDLPNADNGEGAQAALDYDYFIIVSLVSANTETPTLVPHVLAYKGLDGFIMGCPNHKLARRKYSMDDEGTKIVFSDCEYCNTYGSATTNNDYLIPMQIFGVYGNDGLIPGGSLEWGEEL